MHTYEAALVWNEGKEGRLRSRENPELAVAAPPEFGGTEGAWSGEELLVGSVAACLMSTFLYFVELARLELVSYASASKGLMEKTRQGLRFSGIEVEIGAVFGDERSLRKALSMKFENKLEKYCPVSNAVSCPVRLSLELSEKGRGPTA